MTAAMALSPQERSYIKGQLYFDHIAEYLETRETHSLSHSELERALEKKGRELMRIMLQEHVDSRGPGLCEEPVCGSDEIERTRVRSHQRDLETLFGKITATRTGYGQQGTHSLHPFDAALNLPVERYSFELRRRIAEEAAKNSFDETQETIKKTTGGHVPKRQIEELVQRAAQDFDQFYESNKDNASLQEESGPVLVISVDGKGVVMHEKDLREPTRKAAEKRRKKMGKRLSQGEKKNAKRMSTVAAVYLTQPLERSPEDLVAEASGTLEKVKRPRPEQKRVWASLEKTPEEVIEEVFAEAIHRDPMHKKHWVALVDGDPKQINIINCLAKQKGIAITLIVDIIHVIEYLWEAGRAFHPESGKELEAWVNHRLSGVLEGKAGLMAGGMRRSATIKELTPKERQPIEKCATYLHNKSPYLRYDYYLSEGLPIATGVIEGACRHLVKDRMEITGAKWRLKSAEAVLRLRALRISHNFEEYWEFHEACEHKRNHQDLYSGGVVPATISTRPPLKRNHLTVIK